MLETATQPEAPGKKEALLMPASLQRGTRYEVHHVLADGPKANERLRAVAKRMQSEIRDATGGAVELDTRQYEQDLIARINKSDKGVATLVDLESNVGFYREMAWILKQKSRTALATLDFNGLRGIRQVSIPLRAIDEHPQGKKIVQIMQKEFPHCTALEELLQNPGNTTVHVTTCGQEILSAICAIPMGEDSVYLDWFSKNKESSVRSFTEASLLNSLRALQHQYTIAAHVDPNLPVAEWIIEHGGARSIGIDTINGTQYLSVLLDSNEKARIDRSLSEQEKTVIMNECDKHPQSIVTLMQRGKSIQCMALDVTTQTRASGRCDERITSLMNGGEHSVTHVFRQEKKGVSTLTKEPRRYLVFDDIQRSRVEPTYREFLKRYYKDGLETQDGRMITETSKAA